MSNGRSRLQKSQEFRDSSLPGASYQLMIPPCSPQLSGFALQGYVSFSWRHREVCHLGSLDHPSTARHVVFLLSTCKCWWPERVIRIVLASWVRTFGDALLFRNRHQRLLWRARACYETCSYLLGWCNCRAGFAADTKPAWTAVTPSGPSNPCQRQWAPSSQVFPPVTASAFKRDTAVKSWPVFMH